GLEQEAGEPLEVSLEPRLVEGDLRELEEVVLEVVEIPEDRLAIERGPRIGDRVVDDPAADDLEARELLDHLPVDREHRGGEPTDRLFPGRRECIEQRSVAEILLEVRTVL